MPISARASARSQASPRPGPYDIDHVRINSYELYTNLVPAGAMRGFGIPQLVWAYESHTDIIARTLGIDPIAFRRQNLLRDGRAQATGTVMRDAAIEQVLDALARHMNWSTPLGRGEGAIRRGRGIAIGFKASVAPTASVAVVNIGADGSTVLAMSTVDMGQGSDTAMAQIAAEVLGVEADTVRVVHPDTDVTPFDMGTLGSRSTFHMGHAVRLAAQDARSRLQLLAQEAGLPPGTNYPPAEIFQKRYGMQAGNVIGTATYVPTYRSPDKSTGLSDDVTPFWMIGGTGAEIEVDVETGHVRITKLVNAADCGALINPRIVTTQLSGGAVTALGATMFEDIRIDGGQITNASLADYKIPSILGRSADVERAGRRPRSASGPFGAKGVGESGSFAVAPAVANAIDDAVGVRLTRLPLTAGGRAARAARERRPTAVAVRDNDVGVRMRGIRHGAAISINGSACRVPAVIGGFPRIKRNCRNTRHGPARREPAVLCSRRRRSLQRHAAPKGTQ